MLTTLDSCIERLGYERSKSGRYDGRFVKHHLGLSDNVSYFSEQLTASNVSTLRHRVIFKPESIVPDVNIILE